MIVRAAKSPVVSLGARYSTLHYCIRYQRVMFLMLYLTRRPVQIYTGVAMHRPSPVSSEAQFKLSLNPLLSSETPL